LRKAAVHGISGPMKTLIVLLMFIIGLTGWAATPTQVPNFSLVDQNGKTFQLHDLKGNFIFVSYVFTRCPMPKMCPLTMTLNKQLLREWKKKKPGLPLKLLIVTLDPAYDTPAVLKKFGETHKLDYKYFTLVTGEAKTLEDFASNFNVVGVPGEGIIAHNAKSALIGPDLNEIKMYRDNEWKPAEVLKDAGPASLRSPKG
jgi:protein SCO1